MKIGNRLRELRKQSGLSQKDLATVFGVSQATIANYEKHMRQPSIDQLIEIANHFNVSVDELLGLTRKDDLGFDANCTEVTLADRFLSLLLEHDDESVDLFAKAYLKTYGYENLLFYLFRYTLTKLGWLWEVEEITISEEHYISHQIELMISRYIVEPKDHRKKSILAMTAKGEKHTLGLKMVCEALKYRGYQVVYIGEGVPIEDLKKFIEKHKPDTLIVSMTSPLFKETVVEAMKGAKVDEKIVVGMGTTGFHMADVVTYRNYKTCLEAVK